LVGGFILMGLIGFIIPQITIAKKINSLKNRELIASEDKLSNMISKGIMDETKENNLSEVLGIYVYYDTVHKRIMEVKTYPFDLSIIIELLASILIPIFIGIISIYG
jgi:hypothetical protein